MLFDKYGDMPHWRATVKGYKDGLHILPNNIHMSSTAVGTLLMLLGITTRAVNHNPKPYQEHLRRAESAEAQAAELQAQARLEVARTEAARKQVARKVAAS